MEIPLNIRPRERQQAFLDYLNAALRQRAGPYFGSARDAEDGSFVLCASGPFQVGQATALLNWYLTKNPDGELTKLVIEYAGKETADINWESTVYEFVIS